LPANVTDTAGLSNKALPTTAAGGPPVHTSGFTRYVVSGSPGNAQLGNGKGAAPQWFAQGSAAGNTPHPRWLTQGSAANVPVIQQTASPPAGSQTATGAKGVTPLPTPTPQQITATIKQAPPSPALQQISAAVKGAATPLWLSQASAAGQVKGVQKTGTQQNGAQPATTQATTPVIVLKK
jgi:hypothetical protein